MPKPGSFIEYEIRVTDTEGNEPMVSARRRVNVPIGVNVAVTRSLMQDDITYSYSHSEGVWMLSANVENNGSKELEKSVGVYFFEGSPDTNRDNVVDPDARMLSGSVIGYGKWSPGEGTIQTCRVSIKLSQPLLPGFHQIFV